MLEWQPIENVPVSTLVLLWLPSCSDPYAIGMWNDGKWLSDEGVIGHKPSHWMPLPEPPK